ncbi:MAG: hypothetical protein ABEJ22_02065 [Haloferacaceae archaeon]
MSADTPPLSERFPTVGGSGDAPGGPAASRRIAELEAEVAFLRAELDRQQRAQQDLIDRYEMVLEQRQSQHTPERPDGDSVTLRAKRLLGLR